MENQRLSHMQKKPKISKKVVGLLGDYDNVIGWLCPFCKSEFDKDSHLTKFMGETGMRGEA